MQETTQTDADGNFAFETLPDGMYRVTLEFWEHPRKGQLQRRVDVHAGTTARADFDVTPYAPRTNRSNMPMPYGAPPMRRRIA